MYGGIIQMTTNYLATMKTRFNEVVAIGVAVQDDDGNIMLDLDVKDVKQIMLVPFREPKKKQPELKLVKK